MLLEQNTAAATPPGATRRGPLHGVKVIDLSALGPGPFASMMLADFGAEVLCIRRPGRAMPFDPSGGLMRGKRSLQVDLKDPEGVALVRRLVCLADVLLESARPGVMERLGLGPETFLKDHPRLIYARLTGWGQSGPYAHKAGHDTTYLAVSGALGVSGLDAPSVPPALFGDIANGSYLAAFGIVAALLDRESTSRGQVVDAAICDGAAFGMASLFGEYNARQFDGTLGTHLLAGRAPFYRLYRCADHRWYVVGAIESKFYAAFVAALKLDNVGSSEKEQWNKAAWPDLCARLDALFATAPRDEWVRRFADVDACTAPVLEFDELADDAHIAARRTVVRAADGSLHSAPAPRLSAYPTMAESAGQSEPKAGYGWLPDDMDLSRWS